MAFSSHAVVRPSPVAPQRVRRAGVAQVVAVGEVVVAAKAATATESASAANSHSTAVETTTTETTATVETTTATAVAATATTTAGLSLGYKQATNQHSGRQYSHCSFQHASPYVKRLISLGFKWTLGHFRPTANSAIVSNENRRTNCRRH
jgi:hypothetical protein